ncbi:FAD-dependent oxidoreductase [Streptomyces armeniacus]|uniref:FAD-dependent oxidoreductase n=1 Tax=Streptomyces armeniacus TaxID=83291 RepID=A0A345XJM3_9ACTN|nr:FAD-dependent oxidoreductase [Streptomyces armeniacus]AXK31839.1 FAD-dependent oxidoreductase [Streptomyces armeniacus]
MRILVTIPSPDLETSDFLLSGNVVYAPALNTASDGGVLEALLTHRADALIAPRRPHASLLRRWSTYGDGDKYVAYVTGIPDLSLPPEIHEFTQNDTSLESIAASLGRIERRFTLRHAPVRPLPPRPESREAVLIGAGIVNLVTALYLCRAGYHVTVLDRSPDPGGEDWRRYGCTHAGDDARMFTFTEMDNYNNKDFHGAPPSYFRLPIEKAGWLATGDRPLSHEEQAWIDTFESVPSWLARTYTQDIFAFTAEAFHEWADLRSEHPGLFEDVVLTEGILRVYDDPAHYESALARHRALGAVSREPTAAELSVEFPALARPLDNGTLVGGFLVPGFTVGIHRFSRRLISFLEARGVVFRWNSDVLGVRRGGSGEVTGFDCTVPIPGTAHVIASPGVYGRALVEGSPCQGKIHGVLGGWTRLSNEGARLAHSLKVGRRGHVTEDANVTVAVDADGRQTLVVGSGYGYTGATACADSRQLSAVQRGIADTIERLFPDRDGLPESSHAADNYHFKWCVRPWTATSLGLHHEETTAHGQAFVINGGHNTGGFAQAPAIARAVLASLGGEHHPMHALYAPERFSAFACTARTGE